ncbi:2-keto-4-pentenoate hydratase [Acinetobacter baumannii]|uniref:2-keto-4-pentenoate hydratase n=1 Tax=Acinetobacter baumannii TaxID=470 RepID=UPI00389219CC
MSTSINQEFVSELLKARINGNKIPTGVLKIEDIQQAYAIQQALIEHYIAEKQTSITGWKIALSGQKAKAQYQLTEPVYGRLTKDMEHNHSASLRIDNTESVKLEVELVFVLKQPLLPNEIYTDQQLIAAIAEIRPALEIVNIRWRDWDFNLAQFLADNSAAQAYVLGNPVEINIQNLLLDQVIEFSSHDIQKTSTEMDNPIANYLWLIRKLLGEKRTLNAGEIILTGSLIRPLTVSKGTYDFRILGQHLTLDVQNKFS